MAKPPGRAMGKVRPVAQNGEVAEDISHVSSGAASTAALRRRRPEEILADTFPTAVPASATQGWSVRGRRAVLVGMAVAGVVMVSAGLVLTGGLGPGPGRPKPLQTGPDASILSQNLLRPLEEQTPAAPDSSVVGG